MPYNTDMKVLQINCVYGYSSTGIITRDIQQCCLESGIDAYVAFQKGHGTGNERTYEIGSTLDHKIHAILCRIAGKQAYYSHFATRRLLNYLDQIKPDIVHLHNLHNNYINLNMLLRYLAKKNIKTVITLHDCWYFTGGCFHFASTGCERWKSGCGHCPKQKMDTPALFYDASANILNDRIRLLSAINNLTIVGASKWVAEECHQSMLGIKNITYIHNGFDLSIFRPSPSDIKKQLGLEGKHIILGPASKWLQPINQPTLNYFLRKMANDEIMLLFGCSEKKRILTDKVCYYSYTNSRKELAQLYSMADVMINVSREDTLSSLNLECQACGTPVITYDATGSKETVDDICSWTVKTGDYEALWITYQQMKNMNIKQLSQQCITRIASEFERNTNYQKYIELYKKL